MVSDRFGDIRASVVIDTPEEGDEQLEEDFNDELNITNVNITDPYIALKYGQPNVSVDTSARYVTHNVAGEKVVRQKFGENPDNLSVDGICTRDEANKIDNLKSYEYVEFVSSRWQGFAQVASSNTSPHSDGGTQNKDGEFLHTFTIELVEVTEI